MLVKVSIEYCTQWNYDVRALSLRDSISKKFGVEAELIKGTGGVFEVTLNNSLIFSKKDLGRFPEPLEVEEILDQYEWIT